MNYFQIFFQRNFYSQDLRILLLLAIPIVITGMVEASLGFFSTFFFAHLGADTLAAGALVSWFFFTIMVVLWGTLSAVSTLIAREHGAKHALGVAGVLRDSCVLAIVLAPIMFFLIRHVAPLFGLFGQPLDIIQLGDDYLHALSWGLLPDFMMLVFIQFLIGLGHTRVSMLFTFLWVPIAIFFNYVFVFGKFGFPKLGIMGVGLGQTISFWLSGIVMLTYLLLKKYYRNYFILAFSAKKNSFLYLKDILHVGVPMGLMFSVEVGFFFVLSLLIGFYGHFTLAANQIAIQFLMQFSAVVFAMAQAITVRMGHEIGAGNPNAAARAAAAGMFANSIFMFVVAIFYWVFPEKLIGIDLDVTKYPLLTQLAVQFLAVSAIFQLVESVRISLFGALRALRETRFTLLVSIMGFWFISLPCGWLLAKTVLGPKGFWYGMIIGALVSLVVLFRRFTSKMQGMLHAVSDQTINTILA